MLFPTVLSRKEISKILKSSYLRGMNLASFFAVSKIMIFVTFITNDLLDNRITASQVFVVVTLFEALRFSSTLYFPMAVEKVSEAIVSIRRIEVWWQITFFHCRWILCKLPPFLWCHCVPVRWDLPLSVSNMSVIPNCLTYSCLLLGRMHYKERRIPAHLGAVISIAVAQALCAVMPAGQLKWPKAREGRKQTASPVLTQMRFVCVWWGFYTIKKLFPIKQISHTGSFLIPWVYHSFLWNF